MPVYCNAAHIEQAVESILNQTFTNFELIIIDDASTDDTLQRIKKHNDPRIQVIEKKQNTGYTESLNLGIDLAKGQYIARMDGDDISHPLRFEKQVALLDAEPDVILCGTWYRILGTVKEVHPPIRNFGIRRALRRNNALAHASVMIRKQTLLQNNLRYNPDMQPSEDYDLWVRMLPFGKLKNIPEVLLDYRLHPGQVSQVQNELQQQKADLVRMKINASAAGENQIIEKLMPGFRNFWHLLTKKRVAQGYLTPDVNTDNRSTGPYLK